MLELENSKSAKEYISESYVQELFAIQTREQILNTPASIIKKKKVEETFQMAEAILNRDILSEKFTDEYSELLDNIKNKKEELKELYGVDFEKNSLQAVKNAEKFISEQFTLELEQKENNFKEELQQAETDMQEQINAKNEEVANQIQEIEQKIKDLKSESAQKEKREKEEYDYNLKRERKHENEKRAKAVDERENALSLKENEAQQEKQKRVDQLAEIDELAAKVEGIPNEIETAKAEGAAAKEKELGKEYGYKKYLADKDSQNTINDLQEELDALQNKYEALCTEKASLSTSLEEYNAKNYQLAVDTARSVGGINILNTDNHTYNERNKK